MLWREVVLRNNTRTHVEGGAATMILGSVIRRGKTKVHKLQGIPMVCHQNILWLEVPVVDTQLMAMLHGVQ